MLAGHREVTGLRSLGLLGQGVIHLCPPCPGHAPCLQSHAEGQGKGACSGAAASMVTSWHLWHRQPLGEMEIFRLREGVVRAPTPTPQQEVEMLGTLFTLPILHWFSFPFSSKDPNSNSNVREKVSC